MSTLTPEKYRVVSDSAIIHGVKLVGWKSKNGYVYTTDALDGIAINSQRKPVQVGHFDQPSTSRNGQIRNAVRIGNEVRGDWHLNKKNPHTAQFLEDAEEFPENICLSVEMPQSGSKERVNESGDVEVYEVTAIDHYSIVTDGGTNRGLHESDRSTKVADTINTASALRKEYPELIATIEAEATKRVEEERDSDSAVATLTKERDEAVESRDELQKKLDLHDSLRAKDERKIAIAKEFSELLGETDVSKLPESDDDEKALKASAVLTEEELDAMADREEVVVTSELTLRASTIKMAAKIIESYRGRNTESRFGDTEDTSEEDESEIEDIPYVIGGFI